VGSASRATAWMHSLQCINRAIVGDDDSRVPHKEPQWAGLCAKQVTVSVIRITFNYQDGLGSSNPRPGVDRANETEPLDGWCKLTSTAAARQQSLSTTILST
jgi:hypothetical protein